MKVSLSKEGQNWEGGDRITFYLLFHALGRSCLEIVSHFHRGNEIFPELKYLDAVLFTFCGLKRGSNRKKSSIPVKHFLGVQVYFVWKANWVESKHLSNIVVLKVEEMREPSYLLCSMSDKA